MDVQEKLVELLEKASYECDEGTRDLWDMRQVADGIADFLIDNGVTVQEWISVKDRLPEKDGYYLFERGYFVPSIRVLSFAKDGRKVDKYDFHRGWKNVWYRYDSECGYITIDDVTHWMPLPEPPKGE